MHDAVTLLIRHQVTPQHRDDYEAWIREISNASRQFPGHMGVAIIRPHGAQAPYSLVLRFDTHEHLRDWIESPTRQRLVERARPWLQSIEEGEIETGLEFWFTPSRLAPLHARPFKQFLITLSAIYPLTQLLPWVLHPLQNWIAPLREPWLFGLLVATVLVLLMVYLVMPRYTRFAARWLFS
ncbi:Antibiotic biosynthesis monooxygenase [Pseudomonas sp. ATCC 13867]|uniref:antibiotic biosynthesis monooxygenase n=1 Tax=Pseudomonas sp. ATCC 13867 TaxID=1294143 RepID=UPI0002C4F215|nr:antibiotic biosynthesis monooxygenase [Pseudomonas sp. ATCC 13867]AGI24091.1 Antibiotic biosynthesis monooxygenase [Pseudomonas sp. ATCC 13867]RFQ23179.1 antibiotic biosynthesis monooxygenase [Pseudomonas sp. ATCC 13867]